MILETSISNNPIQPWIEISEATQNQAWCHSQIATPKSRWNAYINELCLVAVLEWLREDIEVNAVPIQASTNIWEVVNGAAIQIENLRCVLIPSTAIDTSELCVPQEWVDIPNWAADYYIAVQVDVEEAIVKIYGYTTHVQLKQQGEIKQRAYSLAEPNLISDLNVLWASRQLCQEVATKAEVNELPFLELAQANNLIDRLGNTSIVFPRLTIPFSMWGALLAHDGFRQKLYERRIGLPEQRSLLSLFTSGISELVSLSGWNLFGYQVSFTTRGSNNSNINNGAPPLNSYLSRQLEINGQQYDLQIQPEGDIDKGTFRIFLESTTNIYIPSGFILRLLTEDLQSFPDNESIADGTTSLLEITVTLEEGEGIVWEIEPTPLGYEREIFRF